MDGPAFDEMSRAMARGLPRRQVLTRLGAGGLGAALLAAAGIDRARAVPAAQADSCRLELVATVRLGPSAGAVLAGTTPGELRGQLTFGLGDGGAIDRGRLRLADGTELPVVGQVVGRAINLRVQVGARQPLVLVGTAEEDLGTCRGLVDGLLTGPQAGDLGDWHATATPLQRRGQSGSGSQSGSGGGQSGGTDRPPRGTPAGTGTATATATGTATATATTEPDECPDGEERCDEACVDLQTDPAHCGACDNACQTGNCRGGICMQVFCAERNLTLCGDNCCNADEVCQGGIQDGMCRCLEAGKTTCNNRCVDLQSDLANCGVCGNLCPAGTGCQGGTCLCSAGLPPCGDVCPNLSTDPAHCGACGNACGAGQVCEGGICIGGAQICTAGLTDCGGVCVDVFNDPVNCGACGNPCASGVCEDGVCVIVDTGGQCVIGLGRPCVVGGPRCCSGVCFDGICQCTPIGYLCNLDSDCCSGSCNDLTGFCD